MPRIILKGLRFSYFTEADAEGYKSALDWFFGVGEVNIGWQKLSVGGEFVFSYANPPATRSYARSAADLQSPIADFPIPSGFRSRAVFYPGKIKYLFSLGG